MGVASPPDTWRTVRLSEIGEVNRGRSRHRPRYAEHLYGGPYPFIQTGDIKASGGRITTYTQTYSEAGLAQSRLWPARTMCITIAANIAETAILTFPACFPDSVVGFIADESKCDVWFVEYMLRLLRLRIQHEATGSVQDNINLETLERLHFPLPPLDEQRAVARILGMLDDKIALNRRMNETLEAMARAIFKSWFVDFDPVGAKAEGRQPSGMDAATAALFPDSFEDSPLGKIPKGWKVQNLDDIAHFLNGLALQKYPPEDGQSLPVIKIAQLRKGDTQDADRASARIPPEYVIEDGDVLFSWSGSLEVEIWCGGPGALNQHLFKVTSAAYPKWFYLYWIRQHLSDFQAIAAGKATTMGHIQRHHLKDARVLVPSDGLLAAMNKVISSLVEATTRYKLQSRTIAAARDSLLPKLISGEIRVQHLDNWLEEVPR